MCEYFQNVFFNVSFCACDMFFDCMLMVCMCKRETDREREIIPTNVWSVLQTSMRLNKNQVLRMSKLG
jgi:hypothetical protein